MADYRILYSNLKTGEILGELPAIRASFTDSVNSPGSASVSVLLEDTYVMEAPDGLGGFEEVTTPQAVSLSALIPGATGLYVERDGVILWGGVLWSMQMSVRDSVANLSAEGFMSYLRRLHIQQDLQYTSQDQGAIAKDLLEKAMAKGGADIGLTATLPATSVSRDRLYPAIERKSYGEAIEQLANVRDGFVWRFEHSWNGTDQIDSIFQMDVSALGRLTDYVFDLGVNMVLLDLSLDGSLLANYAEAWGQADSSEAGFYRSDFDSAAITSFPLLETIQSFTDIKKEDSLQKKAEELTARGASAMKRVSLEVFPDAIPTLGSYEVGDRVQVRGSYGGLVVSGVWRIMSLAVSVDTDGREVIQLSLVPQEVF